MQGSAFGAIIDIMAQHQAAHVQGAVNLKGEQRMEREQGRRRCSSDEDWGMRVRLHMQGVRQCCVKVLCWARAFAPPPPAFAFAMTGPSSHSHTREPRVPRDDARDT
jgi:hypothetical protein